MRYFHTRTCSSPTAATAASCRLCSLRPPIVAAGVLEGKNDINVRLGHRRLGYDLKTERPNARQVAAAVETVLRDPAFRENVKRVAAELKAKRPLDTMEQAILAGHRPGNGRPTPADQGRSLTGLNFLRKEQA